MTDQTVPHGQPALPEGDDGPTPSPEDIEHARHGPAVKGRGVTANALGAAMIGLGKALEPEKHEQTQIEVEAPDDADDDNDELLKRISFGAKDPLW